MEDREREVEEHTLGLLFGGFKAGSLWKVLGKLSIEYSSALW